MHYNELLDACRGVFVPYKTRIGRQLSDYEEIKSELRAIRSLSEYYTKKYRRFEEKYMLALNPNAEIEDDDFLPLQSIVINIIISYSKCFDSARKQQGKESRRLIKLQRDYIKNIDKEALATHDRLMNLRDNYVAHAGDSLYEKYEYVIGIDYEGFIALGPDKENHRKIGSPEILDGHVVFLVDEIITAINDKLKLLQPRAELELSILGNPLKRMEFMNKVYQRLPITDEDLKMP